MSSTRELVHAEIDWDLVSQRLDRFPRIAELFSRRDLMSAAETAPYFCHGMAWRLGTWETEDVFSNLDYLLGAASACPGWMREASSWKRDGRFNAFWGLLWQLQVCECLLEAGFSPSWAETPDIKCMVGGEAVFIECFSSHGASSDISFIEELVRRRLGGAGEVRRRYWLDDTVATSAIEGVSQALLDENRVKRATEEAERAQPVPLYRYQNGGNDVLGVLLRGPGQYLANTNNAHGQPHWTLQKQLDAAIEKKARQVRGKSPNLVAVSALVGGEVELALAMRPDRMPESTTFSASAVEAITVSTVSVTERLSLDRMLAWQCSSSSHPLVAEVGRHRFEHTCDDGRVLIPEWDPFEQSWRSFDSNGEPVVGSDPEELRALGAKTYESEAAAWRGDQ